MKTLHVLVLLCSAALLCGAAPVLTPVTCSEDSGAVAARLAVHRINEHHHHGYKFQLSEIKGSKMDVVDDGCTFELHLDLWETKCHYVNPKHFEDCEKRSVSERAVVANCTVMMSVTSGVTTVTKYECDTKQERTNLDMMMLCPDCPSMAPLNDMNSLRSIRDAVVLINTNMSNEHTYMLQEVGRIISYYIPSIGMKRSAEFVVVETDCVRGTKIAPEACRPLCPDQAHVAFCQTSFSSTGLDPVECEYYPPVSTTPGDPGEIPMCRRTFGLGPPLPGGPGGPPPHAGGPPPHAGGPPPHAGGPPPHAGGPPPHAGGPPPHAGGGPPPHAHAPPPPEARDPHGPPGHKGSVHPLLPLHPCHAFRLSVSDPAIHPICPFPPPGPRPRPSDL